MSDKIRRIEKDDIPDCVRIIRKSFLTVAQEFGFTEENAPRFTGFAVTEERLNCQYEDKNRVMYACFHDDDIVGYYSLHIQENSECELNNLCVIPEYRHGGIGEKLLIHSFEAAKELGCKKMFVGIVEENTRLRKWYESFGVKHIGTEKFDFFPFTCGYMEKTFTTAGTEGDFMKYFINENQRKERHSTCFIEFQRGKYDGKCWKEDSLNISFELFNAMSLGKILDEVLTDFDYYDTNEVSFEQWEKLKEILSAKGKEYEELLTELEPWVNENFKKFKVFTVCGM